MVARILVVSHKVKTTSANSPVGCHAACPKATVLDSHAANSRHCSLRARVKQQMPNLHAVVATGILSLSSPAWTFSISLPPGLSQFLSSADFQAQRYWS